jgi:methyltransferase (TIGR00027 family)
MHVTGHSRTAEFMALFRALESASDPANRLFNDPWAIRFLRPPLRAVATLAHLPLVRSLICRFIDRRWPGARTSGVARTRYIDDTLCKALSGGINQLVLLGAGFDSRASRLPQLAHARVFEVDHPNTSRMKQSRIGQVPAQVRYVAIDFNRQMLDEALCEAGLDLARPALFLWEGVTQYLTANAVDATFKFITRSAPGSQVLFTYVHADAIDSQHDGMAALNETLRNAAEPWIFGLDPRKLPEYLARRGLRLISDLNATAYRILYANANASATRPNTGYEFYRVALATVS